MSYADYQLEESLALLQMSKMEFGPGSIDAEQERHLQSLIVAFQQQFQPKYRKGAIEHKGKLWELSPLELIRNAKEEVLDQWSFLCTLEDQLIEADAMKPHHGA